MLSTTVINVPVSYPYCAYIFFLPIGSHNTVPVTAFANGSRCWLSKSSALTVLILMYCIFWRSAPVTQAWITKYVFLVSVSSLHFSSPIKNLNVSAQIANGVI